MPHGDFTLNQVGLDVLWQAQQPERVRDGGPVLADPIRQILLAESVLLDQGPVRGGELDRVEILPLDVLDKSDLDRLAIGRIADERGNRLQACRLRGPPPALAENDFIARIPPPDHDGLEYPLLADRCGQLREARLVEALARLQHIWVYIADQDRSHVPPAPLGLTEERRQSPPQRLSFRHQAPFSRRISSRASSR